MENHLLSKVVLVANLTQTIDDPGDIQLFELDGSTLLPGILPLGRVIHRGQDAITLTGATDTMVVSIAMPLPPGYAYKVTKAEIVLQTADTSDMGDWQAAAQVEFDADGDDVYFGEMGRTTINATSTAFTWLRSVTNDVMAQYTSHADISQIWSGQSLTQIFARLNNISGNATAASSLIHHFETLLYTIEQTRKAHIHISTTVN